MLSKNLIPNIYKSVQFSRSVMSNSLRPHEPQHTRPPCPSPTPGVYPNPCPLSWWCHPAISSSVVPFSSCPIFPSIRVFSNVSTLCIKWPKYWSFSFNISPSNGHPGLISSRMDWLDLLTVQGTLKSLLQHHSSKASILWCSAFFIVQLSHPYITTGKTIALTRWIFVDKVMSLLFNMLSRLVITFPLRCKCLLISRLQSPSAVILEPRKIVSHYFPIYLPWSDTSSKILWWSILLSNFIIYPNLARRTNFHSLVLNCVFVCMLVIFSVSPFGRDS